MAEAEERHAHRWETKLRDLGADPPVLKNTIGRRLSRWWRQKLREPKIAIRRMEATEERQEAEFHEQAERALAAEEDVQEFLRKSAIEEKAHARALSADARRRLARAPRWNKILKAQNAGMRGGSWVADAI